MTDSAAVSFTVKVATPDPFAVAGDPVTVDDPVRPVSVTEGPVVITAPLESFNVTVIVAVSVPLSVTVDVEATTVEFEASVPVAEDGSCEPTRVASTQSAPATVPLMRRPKLADRDVRNLFCTKSSFDTRS